MKNKSRIIIILFFLCNCTIIGQHVHSAVQRIFLTANLNDIDNVELFNERISRIIEMNNAPFTFVINGDLLGENQNSFSKLNDSLRINSIINNIKSFKNSSVFVNTGDRDWEYSGPNGFINIQRLHKIIKNIKDDNVKSLVNKGCPGPKSYLIGEKILIITINTQWWNHEYYKPTSTNSKCKFSNTSYFKEELEDLIQENRDKHVIILGHHPVKSLGMYGGHFPLLSHFFPLTTIKSGLIFPLPIIGSAYISFRQNIGYNYDITNGIYEDFNELLLNIIDNENNILYLSGHEKNLQILKTNSNYFINSGSPEKSKYVDRSSESIIAESSPGIIELTLYDNGSLLANTHIFEENDISFITENVEIIKAMTYSSEYLLSDDNNLDFPLLNSVNISAGEEYSSGFFHEFLFGKHYRKEWTKSIQVPVLSIDTAFGGLTPIKKGGGRQTKSLKFEDSLGNRFTFRSVNKDPIKAIDYDLRNTILVDIVRDQTTTQHPYGALVVDKLLNNLDILHAHPKLYVLSGNYLDQFKNEYAGMLGMLEESPRKQKNRKKGFGNSDNILKSGQLFQKLYKSKHNKIDQNKFIRARLFDILVGDWGKHEDNWKWAAFNKKDHTVYEPIPRDRDHVFSKWDGLLPWFADREWAKQSGENFDFEIAGLRSLMFQARHLDRVASNEMTLNDWLTEVKFIQSNLDSIKIISAINSLPLPIKRISGIELKEKLIRRLEDLNIYAKEYFAMLAEEVDIVGSNEDDYFEIIRNSDGSVTAKIFDTEKNYNKGSKEYYSRLFLPEDTKEIRLYGLDGVDVFNFYGNSIRSIPIRVIGGQKEDLIFENSAVSNSGNYTIVYDSTISKESIITKQVDFRNTGKNSLEYNRTDFKYDSYFPTPYVSYSADDGLVVSPGIEFTTHSFGKDPFSSKHKIRLTYTTEKSIGIDYGLILNNVFNEWNFNFDISYSDPTRFTYFYGLGNNSQKDKQLFNDGYYRTRYNSKSIQLGFDKVFWKRSIFNILFNYENNEGQVEKEKNVLSDLNIIGEDKINLISIKSFLDIDFRNSKQFPTNGMRFFATFESGIITNLEDNSFTKYSGFIEAHSTFNVYLPLTISMRYGAAKSIGQLPFYKLFSLGQNNYLRGFRNNRFSGDAISYLNAEAKLTLFKFNTFVAPLNFGVKGFFDLGKIIEPTHGYNKYHNGYGLGIFITPMKKMFELSFDLSFSKEEDLMLKIGIGSFFN